MKDSILSADKDRLPRIVIAGKPNVGKSTLFNRLVGTRRAITDPTPGVTRDPLECRVELQGRPVMLIDTGGFKLEKNDMDELVVGRSREMIESADLILLMVDVAGISPEDEQFIEYLRSYADKLLLVVNKIDNEQRSREMWEFAAFGFDIVGISAVHGSNMDELEHSILARVGDFTAEEEQVPQPAIKLAIVGKPNTGKSTLMNLLAGNAVSIVSHIPGTTRDVIEGRFIYKDQHFKVLDTAGIRRKNKVTENVEYYSVNRAIKTIERADLVFLMIDAEEGLSDQDKKIASIAVTRGKGIILVLNKWDKLENIPNRFQAVEDRIRFLFPVLSFSPIVPISALEHTGIEQLLSTAVNVWNQLNRESSTSSINKALGKWQDRYSPPSGSRRVRYKVRYCTQAGTNPVRFALFVNKKRGFPQGYIQFIKNQLRKDFGYSQIPIIIDTREG